MLMITSSRALSKLPYDRALPFNSRDLMIMVNPQIGFRLKNICNEIGGVFDISSVCEENKKVFGDVSLNDRAKEFLQHFRSRVERYFITRKSEYIFFDTEEQEFLRKTMSAAGLSCSVDVFVVNESNDFEMIDYRMLNEKKAKNVIRFLSDCAVREVIDCMESYRAKNYRYRPSNFSMGKRSMKFEDDIFDEYSRYSKLKLVSSKESFKKYMKALRVKYHPDKCKDENAEEISKVIAEDIENLKKTKWYIDLPDKTPAKEENESDSKENDKAGDNKDDNGGDNSSSEQAV